MIRYRQWLLRIPGVKRGDGFHKALAVKVELVLAHTVDSQKLRIGNRLDTGHVSQCLVGKDDVRRFADFLGDGATQFAQLLEQRLLVIVRNIGFHCSGSTG